MTYTYDQAFENIRKKNKKSQRRSTDDAKNNDTNDVATSVVNNDTSATNRDQHPVRKATRKALIRIGKVTYDQARGNIRKKKIEGHKEDPLVLLRMLIPTM